MIYTASRPVIGLTTQTLHSIDGIPPALPQSWVMNQRYFQAATMVGGVPWMIPLFDDDLPTLREIYERLDGILIPGGVDMNPRTYGEDVLECCGNLDPARDRVELQLTEWAIEERKPVLGLCRGLQVMNVAMGGSLWQDLRVQNPEYHKHDYFPNAGFPRDHLAHEVTLAPGTRLASLLERRTVAVNSMHHQGIKVLAPSLIPSAVAPDGLIEAAEREGDHFFVGVQWHPEVFELADPHMRHLFGAFIAAARRFQQERRHAGVAA
ncbi:MAG: gamma-glutamyl-gamma-aminobutyrate hydrolase family protein [Gemmatimonadaceae bacterium]|jgi:putative glutamine amidotransferase|nr:gamma-glutamyl-gamma-aminobutyrate hydrolase family protein [Gemmatimonadaceae bacterium]